MARRKTTTPAQRRNALAVGTLSGTFSPPEPKGLTEDELEEVRIALQIDDNAGLAAILKTITHLDNEVRILDDVRGLFDVDKGADLVDAIGKYQEEQTDVENARDNLVAEIDTVGGSLEELWTDLRELVSILEPKLGGFRDGEPREVFDLRVLVDRFARRLQK